ncbi:putative DD41D transposase [Trichonephila clavipes]|uniref:Putative DD41D transposase n=1 Tax=Trichonephila clavipes TaxID=2585209 RepID=A0A8X6WHL7_TRICX|nr:putative DD41D transposase [Trichonephila clavipes]
MINNFFIPELNNHDVQELWFQQDGATCHTARATIDLLKDTLGDRLISRFGPVNWPPRSCDLTPLDYFLWGYVKSLVYADKPQTLDHLEDNIRRVNGGFQKLFKDKQPRANYVHCSTHNLNLVLNDACNSVPHSRGRRPFSSVACKTNLPIMIQHAMQSPVIHYLVALTALDSEMAIAQPTDMDFSPQSPSNGTAPTPCEELTAMKNYIRRLQIICNEKENTVSLLRLDHGHDESDSLPVSMERVPGTLQQAKNDRPTSSDNDRVFGGTLILVKNAINRYSLPTPPMQAIEATIVIPTPFDHDPISIDLLPAPGNRSNEAQYREEDLATAKEKSPNEERKKRVARKTWSDKEETAGRCIVAS